MFFDTMLVLFILPKENKIKVIMYSLSFPFIERISVNFSIDELRIDSFCDEVVNIISTTSYIIYFATILSIYVVVSELASKGAVYLFSGWVPMDEIYDFVTNWWILIWYIPLWIIGQIFGCAVVRGK